MSSKFQSYELDKIRQAFKEYDKDGSQTIDTHELEGAMSATGCKVDKNDIKMLLNEVDTDNSGNIDFDEFCEMIYRVRKGDIKKSIKLAHKLDQWVDIQMNTFKRWVNNHLKTRGLKIENLKTDFKDGLSLIALMEVISGKKMPRYNRHPRIPVQQRENCAIAIDFIMKVEKVKLVNISGDDIHKGDLKLILGLIWTLILKYDIGGKGDKDAYNDLLRWVRKKIPKYNINNFKRDWNDGRAICALVDALRPGLIPNHWDMNPSNAYDNAKKGIETGEKKLGVPILLLPEEMTHPKVDEHSVMTYIAQYRNLEEQGAFKIKDSSLCRAWGPGLQEAIAGEEAPFNVETPPKTRGILKILVHGPSQEESKVKIKNKSNGLYDVVYIPKNEGDYTVNITLDDEHIPGSPFTVLVLPEVSLGGEGKIRVYYSTTYASNKARKDTSKLQKLLAEKKIHLRPDFEPWIPVDVMEKQWREAVYTKAGTRNMPIVFIDDHYTGDYDRCKKLNETNELDKLVNALAYKGPLLTEEEHMKRLRVEPDQIFNMAEILNPSSPTAQGAGKVKSPRTKPVGSPKSKKKCKKCGEPVDAKFCENCGAQA